MAKSELTPMAKAAIVVITVGAEEAAAIYQNLNEEEVEQLSLEIAKLENLSPEAMQEAINEFYGLCVAHGVIAEGGVLYARDVLVKAFGEEKADEYLGRLSTAMKPRPFEFIRKASSKNILMTIRSEHPQTMALVLSYAQAGQASEVIAGLPKDLQMDVVRRIATIDSVSPEITHVIEKSLEERFAKLVSDEVMEIGGVHYAAEIINHTDRTVEKHIFAEMEKTDPALSEEIRKLMFVFEDIVVLSDLDTQRVLRDVEMQDLAVAVKGASEEIRDFLLNNVSVRARETILEDIQYMRNVRIKDVESAQQRIVNVIRSLEEAGEIVVARGGDEDGVIA